MVTRTPTLRGGDVCLVHASTSLWVSFGAFEIVHGHPEYETRLVWIDEEPA